MKTFSRAKRKDSEGVKVEVSFQQRMLAFLLRDLVPTLLVIVILAIAASFVARGIERAKTSHRSSAVETDLRP